MPALDLIQQTVTAPLRLVQGAVGNDEALADLRGRLDRIERELERSVTASVERAITPITKRLANIEAELTELRQRLDGIAEDVDHIRTRQAAQEADES